MVKVDADIDGDVNVAILDVAEDVDVNVVSDHNIGADDDLVTKFRTFALGGGGGLFSHISYWYLSIQVTRVS